MAKAKFFLKDPKSNKSTLVYLIFQFNYFELINGKKKFKVLKMSSGETIHPDFWDPSEHRARATKKFSEYREFNQRLTNLARVVEDEYRKILNDELKPDPDMLRSNVYRRLGKNEPAKVKNMDLFRFIDIIIEDTKQGKRLTDTGGKFSNFTIKGYTTTLNHLKSFQEDYNRKIDFETIDLDFYDDFLAFFHKDNKATNSIGKHIKNLKVFMKAAYEKGFHSNLDFQNKQFKTIEEQTDSIYLNENELLKIYKLDLRANKTLNKVRDLFLIGSYTGLRYSDFYNIQPANIKKTEKGTFLHLKTQKTKTPVVVPINWIVNEILARYEFRVPKPYTNQEMNRDLKIIGKKAKIKEKVILTITKGGMRIETVHKKHELITTHTARRSFATNAYLAGIPTISIMKITGHKTEKSFMRYIKMSQEDNANKLIEHPYFSQQKPAELKKV